MPENESFVVSGAGAQMEKEGPYNEAALDAELDATLVRLKDELKEFEAKGIRNLGIETSIGIMSQSREQAFKSFQNNFYLHVGRALGVIDRYEGSEEEYSDILRVLKETHASRELMFRAADSKEISDPEVCALLRKIYIGMKNRGYTHDELYF